jgi:hypothetical protein
MAFHTISIEKPTKRVLGKLRKGGRVRIMSGTGMNVIVQADRYNPITKSFNKGKAYTLELSPAEIEANMNPPEDAPQMEGQGIFDDLIKYVAVPVAKSVAKEGVKRAVKYAPEIGATLGASALSGLALLAGQPELVPIAGAYGSQLGRAGGKALGKVGQKEANKRIDKYEYRSKSNAPPSRRPDATANQRVVNTASSPVAMSNLSQYLASMTNEDIEMELARRRGGGYSTPFDTSGGSQVLSQYTDPVGQGLGGGLYAQGGGRGRGIRQTANRLLEKASIGIHGNLLGHGLPPALQSQPYSSNFQMASRLPPAFAPIIKSGAGLY